MHKKRLINKENLWWIATLAGLVVSSALYFIALSRDLTTTSESVVTGIAGALLSGLVIGGLVRFTQFAREAEAAKRTQLFDYGRQLRQIHNQISAAQTKMRTHQTVSTYGDAIRDAIMPALASSRGITAELKNLPILGKDRDTTVHHLEEISSYLQGLVDEFDRGYLEFSRLQRLSSHRYSVSIKRLAEEPNTEAAIESEGGTAIKIPDTVHDRYAWSALLRAQEPDASAQVVECNGERVLRFRRTKRFVDDGGCHQRGFAAHVEAVREVLIPSYQPKATSPADVSTSPPRRTESRHSNGGRADTG